jgi:hypothetical protein
VKNGKLPPESLASPTEIVDFVFSVIKLFLNFGYAVRGFFNVSQRIF